MIALNEDPLKKGHFTKCLDLDIGTLPVDSWNGSRYKGMGIFREVLR
jgi:hypothetical protein